MNLANVGYSTGDFQTGLDHGLAAVDLFRKIGIDFEMAAALGNCGWYSLSLENPARAEEFFNESMAVFGQLGAIRHVAATMPGLAATGGRGGDDAGGDQRVYDAVVTRFLHTMVRIKDPEKSRAFYEALGFTFDRDMDIVRDGQLEATNYFFSMGDQESVLELTFNHDGRSYELGTGYGHIAVGVDDLDGTLERLAAQGIEPERPPYQVREGGSRLCFVQDPDGYRIELIGRSS